MVVDDCERWFTGAPACRLQPPTGGHLHVGKGEANAPPSTLTNLPDAHVRLQPRHIVVVLPEESVLGVNHCGLERHVEKDIGRQD